MSLLISGLGNAYSSVPAVVSNVSTDVTPAKAPIKPIDISHRFSNSINAEPAAKSYVAGNASIGDYKAVFNESFYSNIKSVVEKGSLDLSDKQAVGKLLDSHYSTFYQYSLFAVLQDSNAKGVSFHGDAGRDAYYSADSYYIAEDMINALNECYAEIRDEMGIGSSNPPTTFFKNYNELWAHNFQGCVQLDKAAGPPPKGFTMYFNPQKYSALELSQGQTYFLLAQNDTSKGQAGAKIEITVPKGQSLFKHTSLFSKNTFDWFIDDKGRTTYNLTGHISSRDDDILDDLAAFASENIFNPSVGYVRFVNGLRSYEADIPFSIVTAVNIVSAKELFEASDENTSFIQSFTFKNNYMPNNVFDIKI